VSLLGDGNEARDIVGDVFEKAWNQYSSLQMETRRSWLYASVRNACLNWLKHQQVEQTNVEALIEATRYDMSTRYEEHERLLQQAEQIARELKEPTCTILRLCYFEHLTYQQAADRLGISPNTVKKHISKALAILRERMKYTNIEN
jgi:RNA polymerase sigma factor, sigma-70 family